MQFNKCWIKKSTDVYSFPFFSFILGAFAFVYVRFYDGGDVVCRSVTANCEFNITKHSKNTKQKICF